MTARIIQFKPRVEDQPAEQPTPDHPGEPAPLDRRGFDTRVEYVILEQYL
ncbi:hypothetical protein [Paraburkholderia sp. BCC1884]|nr:hypothetical protein [Paraburkholderia sp. BCC1884]